MNVAPRRLREHLAPDESLVAVGSATRVKNPFRKAVSVGLTDRRLLSVARDGEFEVVRYECIASIQSRPRSTGGDGRWLALAVGGLLAVAAFAGVVVLASGPLVSALSALAVGGAVSAAYVRRHGVDLDRPVLAEAVATVEDAIDHLDRVGPHEERITERVSRQRALQVGGGLLAALALVGLVVLAANLLVVPLTIATVGGVALVDYVARLHRDVDGIDVVRDRELDVSVHLVDGRTVHLRLDYDEGLAEELGRLAYATDAHAVDAEVPG